MRQCFLFSNHLIITSRTQGGKLHLVEGVGKIPLADITLIEDPTEESDRPDDQGLYQKCSKVFLSSFKLWFFRISHFKS